MAHRNPTLIEFQLHNCGGATPCPLATEALIGSGLPCCNLGTSPDVKDGRCLTRNGPKVEGIEFGKVAEAVAA